MKVLLDARMVGPQMHGIARYTLTIASLLRTHKVDVTLLASPEGTPILRAEHWNTLTSSVPFATPLEPVLLMKHRSDYKNFDVVHFTSFALPLFPPKNSVATIHDLIHLCTGSFIQKAYYQVFVRLTLRLIRRVIAVSSWTKSELIRSFSLPKDKVQVIGNFLDETWFKDAVPPFQHTTPYFISVANSKPHKNVETLLRASLDLWKRGIDFDLFLVGARMDDFLESRPELRSFGHHLRYFAKISDSELRSLYRGAKAFISTSILEGFNLPVVEALSQKCPVLLSRAEAHLEFSSPLIKFFGQPKDAVALGLQMEQILHQGIVPLGVSDGSTGTRNLSEETFSQLNALYQSLRLM